MPCQSTPCWLLGILGLCAGIAGCDRGDVPSEPSPPNIVILFADDLGYGDLSCYGHPTIRTPHLDRLAAEGVRMTSFYAAAPSCSPSRAALLTGRYPQKVGVPHVLGPESPSGINEDAVTLAQGLKNLGYRTRAIGKWHLGHAQPSLLPTRKGFDGYYGLLYSNDMIPPWVQTEKPLELWRDESPVPGPVDQNQLTTSYTQDALRFIEDPDPRPYFLYLAYSMPHVPIHTSERFRGRSQAGLYGDVIETIDWGVGEILRRIKEREEEQNTIVVFSSDNGPWLQMPDRMFQLDIVKPWDAGSPGPLRGAKATTWEGGQRVPGIIRWKGQIQPGVFTHTASTLDLFPTLLTAAGASVVETLELDGQDILPNLRGQVPPGERVFYYISGWRVEGIRRGNWKLRIEGGIRSDDGENPEKAQLFDLDVDPGERYDRSNEFPERVSDMRRELEQFASVIQSFSSQAPGALQ